MATLKDFADRIDRASSKSELLEILKELKAEFDENEPEVKELIKKLTR